VGYMLACAAGQLQDMRPSVILQEPTQHRQDGLLVGVLDGATARGGEREQYRGKARAAMPGVRATTCYIKGHLLLRRRQDACC
jgi:hypothetical protein